MNQVPNNENQFQYPTLGIFLVDQPKIDKELKSALVMTIAFKCERSTRSTYKYPTLGIVYFDESKELQRLIVCRSGWPKI